MNQSTGHRDDGFLEQYDDVDLDIEESVTATLDSSNKKLRARNRMMCIGGAVTFVVLLVVIIAVAVATTDSEGTCVADAKTCCFTTTDAITKSPRDKKVYRFVTLENCLNVVLVSSPKGVKAGAALEVGVGSFNDPKEYQGMAHFLEHMLFMGSSKYPGEDQYSEAIAKFSGSDNAFTDSERTSYYFSNNANGLSTTVDIFANFFIDPLLNPSSLQREMKAVDNEHQKNVPDDLWRMQQLLATIANPATPVHNFGTGNLDTLNKSTIRDALLGFYTAHYSANRMAAAIISNSSLDDLTDLARSTFNPIANRDVPPPTWEVTPDTVAQPYPTGDNPARDHTDKVHTKKILRIVSAVSGTGAVKRVLGIFVPLPFSILRSQLREFAVSFVCSVVQRETEGSPIYALREAGWSSSLDCSFWHTATFFTTVLIEVQMTEEGEKHFDEVAAVVFESLHRIHTASDGDLRVLWDEEAYLRHTNWVYAEEASEEDLTVQLAHAARLTNDPSDVLRAPKRFTWDSTTLRNITSQMTPQNSIVFHMSSNLKLDNPLIEKYYQTRYTIEDPGVDQQGLWDRQPEALAKPDTKVGAMLPDLALPPKNNFISTEEELEQTMGAPPDTPYRSLMAAPATVISLPNVTVYIKPSHIDLPKSIIGIRLSHGKSFSITTSESVQDAVRRAVYEELVDRSLFTMRSVAASAGLGFEVSTTTGFTDITVKGYASKVPGVLRHVVEAMVDPLKGQADRNRSVVQAVQKVLDDFSDVLINAKQYEMGWRLVKELLTPAAPLASVVDELRGLVAANTSSLPFPTPQYQCVSLILGNYKVPSDAVQSSVASFADLCTGALSERDAAWEGKLPHGWHAAQVRSVNRESTDDAVVVVYQLGRSDDPAIAAKSLMLEQMVSQPFFDQLRTTESHGYLVFALRAKVMEAESLVAIVQGPHSAAHVDARIDAFITSYYHELSAISPDEFRERVHAASSDLFQPPHSLDDEIAYPWSVVTSTMDWGFRGKVAAELENLTLGDFVEWYNAALRDANRRKLSVQVFRYAADGENFPPTNNTALHEGDVGPIHLSSLTDFKASLNASW